MGNSKKKIKFICLPGGGTSPVAFFKWFGLLSPKYRPLFVDIPGRGMRKNEAPYTDIDSITNDLYAGWQKIMSDGREEEYVLFCYCMGSVFMHELVKKIAENHQKMPLHVFIPMRISAHFWLGCKARTSMEFINIIIRVQAVYIRLIFLFMSKKTVSRM